jgi:dGTPase
MKDKTNKKLIGRITRERFRWEKKCLGKYAFPSKNACRLADDIKHPCGEMLDLRNPFAHDTDRIIHSNSYARYMDKTQVFFQIKNDHITRRSLHVQMVSRIARTIGRCLELNEDLIEAIAVGHDIGHTPFGHAGESAISKELEKRNEGVFVHNAQSVRVLQLLEHRGKGCNLTLQVLDGILGHNGEREQQRFYYDHSKLTWDKLNDNLHGCFTEKGFDKHVEPSTMEGCVVRVADMIAYLGRDFEDAITLGLLGRDALPMTVRRVLGSTNHEIVNTLSSDVIENSYKKEFVAFSDKVFEAFTDMKKFNYKEIYGCNLIKEQINRFTLMVGSLFEKYLNDLKDGDYKQSIFTDFVNRFPDSYLKNNSNARIVADFIAGMTDQYFLKQYELCFMPRRIDYDQLVNIDFVNRNIN